METDEKNKNTAGYAIKTKKKKTAYEVIPANFCMESDGKHQNMH